jgi:hypothetical protein
MKRRIGSQSRVNRTHLPATLDVLRFYRPDGELRPWPRNVLDDLHSLKYPVHIQPTNAKEFVGWPWFVQCVLGRICCLLSEEKRGPTSEDKLIRSIILWDITQCSPLVVNRRFGGTSPPSSGSKDKPSNKPTWKQVGNVGWFPTDYTALYSRR